MRTNVYSICAHREDIARDLADCKIAPESVRASFIDGDTGECVVVLHPVPEDLVLLFESRLQYNHAPFRKAAL